MCLNNIACWGSVARRSVVERSIVRQGHVLGSSLYGVTAEENIRSPSHTASCVGTTQGQTAVALRERKVDFANLEAQTLGTA
jgi:hypothetical protein